MGPKGNFLCAKKFYPSTGCFKKKKKVRKKSYQVRLVFGSTFGVWWGLVFATWRGRALGGIRGPPGVGLRWVSGFSFFLGLGVLSKINYKLSIFNLWLLPSSKINISLENTGCFKSRKKEKKFKNKKEKTSGPIPKKALNFLSQDFCFQNKIEKKSLDIYIKLKSKSSY